MKKLDCLKRFFSLNPHIFSQIMEFLKDEFIIPESDIYNYKISQNKPEFMYKLLESIEKKVQLISFTWSILPSEYIIINIVTDKESKEFSYGN